MLGTDLRGASQLVEEGAKRSVYARCALERDIDELPLANDGDPDRTIAADRLRRLQGELGCLVSLLPVASRVGQAHGNDDRHEGLHALVVAIRREILTLVISGAPSGAG